MSTTTTTKLLFDDDSVVSERHARSVLPFQLDGEDDTFVLSGTRQVISSPGAIIHPRAITLSTGKVNSSSTTTSPYNNSLYGIFGAAVVGAVLYHFTARYLTTSSSRKGHIASTDSTTTTTHPADEPISSPPTTTATTSGGHVSSIEEDVLAAPTQREPEDNSNLEVPDLVDEDTVPTGTIVNRRRTKESRLTVQVASPTATLDLTLPNAALVPAMSYDEAQQTATAAIMLQRACAEQGMNCDLGTFLQCAVQSQNTKLQIIANMAQEQRRYCFDSHQQQTNRNLAQQQHQEALEASRADKDWMTRLVSVKDKCVSSLYNAVFYSFAGCLLINAVIPIVESYNYLTTRSLTENVCYGVTSGAPPAKLGSGFTSYIALASVEYVFTKVTEYSYNQVASTVVQTSTNTSFGESLTCGLAFVGRISYATTVLFSLAFISSISRRIGMPQCVSLVISSIFLLFIVAINNWLPDRYLSEMSCAIAVIGLLAYRWTIYHYYKYRNKFQAMGYPPLDTVNKELLFFDDFTFGTTLMPLAFWVLHMICAFAFSK